MYIIYNTTHAHTHIHTHPCDPTKKKKKETTISCTLNRAIVHNLLFKLSVSCLPSPGFPTHVFRPTNYHAYNCLISVPSTLTFRFHRRYILPDTSLSHCAECPAARPHYGPPRTCPNHPISPKLILKRRTCLSYPPVPRNLRRLLRNPIPHPSPINCIHVAIVTNLSLSLTFSLSLPPAHTTNLMLLLSYFCLSLYIYIIFSSPIFVSLFFLPTGIFIFLSLSSWLINFLIHVPIFIFLLLLFSHRTKLALSRHTFHGLFNYIYIYIFCVVTHSLLLHHVDETKKWIKYNHVYFIYIYIDRQIYLSVMDRLTNIVFIFGIYGLEFGHDIFSSLHMLR